MDKRELLKQFLETNGVLIVDKNPSSRNRLLKTMYDMGAKRHMIYSVGSLPEAQEFIQSKKIGIVLSDYFIGGGSGFDLFKILREKFPNNKQLCLILVTSNISQTAVAKAAEEDVDSFIIKPYTIQSIQENLVSTVSAKIKPSEYIVKIDEAKVQIGLGEYDKALDILRVACTLHTKPALALFYMGQAEYLKNLVDSAAQDYNKGLNFNNIHYKCLVGLYEVFIKDDKFHEAYQIVKKIAKYFPANPDRLSQIVRLAIRTGNYQDMQDYYGIFTSLEERLQVLTNYIGAGMYIAGKYCLQKNDYQTAMQYFENIAVSCSEFTKFLRAIVTVLIQYGQVDDAEKFLSRFDPDDKESEDYLVSDFLISSRKFNDNTLTIKIGLQLWNKKIRDYAFMEILIEAMEKEGYNQDKVAPYREELMSLYPDKVIISA
jgi:CheY-like chemotaxis protein